MIKRKQLKTALSFAFGVLFISIFNCCVTSRNVPLEQMSKIPASKNLYYFHAGDSTWIVKPITVAGNYFAGKLYNPEIIRKNRQVHIYAEPLSAVKIENGQLLVSMDKITKVENYRISAGMIIGSIGFVALLFFIPVLL